MDHNTQSILVPEPIEMTEDKKVTEARESVSVITQQTTEAKEEPETWEAWEDRIQQEYGTWGKNKAVGLSGKTKCSLVKVFNAADFIGEVFAEFLGLNDSKYQYVVNAYERHQRNMEEEAAQLKEEEEQREKVAEEMLNEEAIALEEATGI